MKYAAESVNQGDRTAIFQREFELQVQDGVYGHGGVDTGEKVFEADQAHLHHRFLRRGFSQPRAAITIWAWCVSLAAAALATRFIPFRAHGVWHLWPTIGAAAIALVALAISAYVVYVLEIVKVANPYHRRREEQLRKSA